MATLIEDKTHSTFLSSIPSYYDIFRDDEFRKISRVIFSEEYIKPKQQLYNFEITFPKSLKVMLNSEFIISIPYELRDLYREINKSKYILELQENHDDQGASKYSISTWKKAIIFLAKYNSWVYSESSKIVPSPKIFHGPDGSVDIQWKTDDFKLLINIPEENNIATFFGNYQNNQDVEGSFHLDNYKFQLLPSLVTV
jgi:hypothetical protein